MIARVLLSLLATALGLYALFLAADPLRLLHHLHYFEQHGVTTVGRASLAAVGLVFLAIVPAQILVWSLSRRYAKTIRYRVGADQVTVSLQAVEEALSRALEIDADVRTATVRILSNRWLRRIEVACALVLYEDTDVSVTDSRCQQLLRARFKEVMSGAKRVRFALHIDRLRSRASDPGQARLAAAPARLMSSRPVAAAAGAIAGIIGHRWRHVKEAAAVLLAGRNQNDIAESEILKSSQAVTEVEPVYDDDSVSSLTRTPVSADVMITPAAVDADADAADAWRQKTRQPLLRLNRSMSAEDLPTNLYAGPSYPVGGGFDDDEDDEDESRSRPQLLELTVVNHHDNATIAC